MTHPQLRERRQKIARAIEGGMSQARVAQRFCVTIATVKAACGEFIGSETPLLPNLRLKRVVLILSMLIQTRKPLKQIAESDDVGVSRESVRQLYGMARERGIKMPIRR